MDRIAEIKKEIESIDTIDDSNIIRLESLCEERLALNKGRPAHVHAYGATIQDSRKKS